MLVEFALLIVVAVGVFAFVLAPLVRPAAVEEPEVDEQVPVVADEPRDSIPADSQPVRESS